MVVFFIGFVIVKTAQRLILKHAEMRFFLKTR